MPIKRVTLRLRQLMHEQDSYDILLDCHHSIFAAFNEHKFEKFLLAENPNPMTELNLILEIKNELNKLDERKPLLSMSEKGTHYAYELFIKKPCEWIGGGCRYLWAYISRQFSNVVLPITQNELIQKYLNILSEFSIPYAIDESVNIKEFSHEGENSGEISGLFTQEALDVLLERLKDFNYE